MSIRKKYKGLPSEPLGATGLLYHDWDALTPFQRDCTTRFVKTVQIEQEAYLNQHPEIKAMLSLFTSSMTLQAKRKDVLKAAGHYFVRKADEIEEDIRKLLNNSPKQPSYMEESSSTKEQESSSRKEPPYNFKDEMLDQDLNAVVEKHHPPPPWSCSTSSKSLSNTLSSSFLSVQTSETTLPTPEPEPIPDPTISEVFYNTVSNAVDKAIFSHVDDRVLRYDTAYVELMKCVEEAMEVPVIGIREDIAQLLYKAYYVFKLNIIEKERIAAEIAWENRMRKKLKRSLRRMNNFKGYETPPTPKSEISVHESYKVAPQRPCECQPQWHYNRYPKDRFGIYLPMETEYSDVNVTATPAISVESIIVKAADDDDKRENIMHVF